MCYLGPGNEDLDDVQRLLSQTLQPSAPKKSFSYWTGNPKLEDSVPSPIEIGKGLPLVARGTQWSRWTGGVSRKSGSTEGSKREDRDEAMSNVTTRSVKNEVVFKRVRASLLDGLKNVHSETTELSSGDFWDTSSLSGASAVFGHVIYPLEKSKEMLKQGGIRDNRKDFDHRRDFLTTFPGILSFLRGSNIDRVESGEELRIRLIPSQNLGPREKASLFPILDICVNIIANPRSIRLAKVQLAIEEREYDLLLPAEATDIRFLADSHIFSGAQVDPRITDFLEASNLNVFGQERLKTPPQLTLSVPAHAIWNPQARDSRTKNTSTAIHASSHQTIEYKFSSLEHQTFLSWPVPEGTMKYTVIEAGMAGGRREELRMVLKKDLASSWDPSRVANKDLWNFYNAARTVVSKLKDISFERQLVKARRVSSAEPPQVSRWWAGSRVRKVGSERQKSPYVIPL